MERLTFEGNFCDIAQCRENPCPYNGNCSQREVWERLKQYEDKCESPEVLERALDMEEILGDEYYSVNRMLELLKADKEGRVVVHGMWDDSGRYTFPDGRTAVRCSECGCALTEGEYHMFNWNFCPVCGAKMDGGNSDAAD